MALLAETSVLILTSVYNKEENNQPYGGKRNRMHKCMIAAGGDGMIVPNSSSDRQSGEWPFRIRA